MLIDAATNPERRVAFQRALLEVDIFAATPNTLEEAGWRTVRQGEHFQLRTVRSPKGIVVPAIFTSEQRVADVFGPRTGFVQMKGAALLDAVAKDGAWLNPGLPYGVHWDAEQLCALLGRPISRTLQKQTKIVLGAPAQPPEELIESLKVALGGDPSISEAWFALAHWPEDGKYAWYLDVRTDLLASEVNKRLADVFKGANFAGHPLDLVVKKPGDGNGVGIRIVPAQTH
jgi:hypothetical protein